MANINSAASTGARGAALDFDIPVVSQQLGGSLIWEEYKGSFANARAAAETALHATAGQSGKARAEALLASGIVQMMQGDLYDAQRCFAEMDRVAVEHPDLRYFAFACDHVARMYQYRLGPAGGVLTVEIEQRWDGITFAGTQEERFTALRARAQGASAHMQSALLFNVLAMMPVQRQMLDNSAASLPKEQLRQFAGTLLSGAWNFQKVAVGVGTRNRILAFIDLFVADAARRAAMPDVATASLQRSVQGYLSDGDAAGAACCHMTWADWSLAPSSSPVVWNLLQKEGFGDGSNLSWIDENREFQPPAADLKQIRETYAIAAGGFAQDGAARGAAALKLRYAWLSMLEEAPGAAADLFEEARALAEGAGDHLLAQQARVSAALARVAIQHRYVDNEGMRDVGEWGALSGSISYACGLGLLTSRVARHFLLRRGDYQRAGACYRMAQALFQGLGMMVNEALSFIDLGNLNSTIGARSSSIEAFETASAFLREGSKRYPGLEGQMERLGAEIDFRLYKLYEAMADPDGIERVVSKLSARMPRTDGLFPKPTATSDLVRRFLSAPAADVTTDMPEAAMNFVIGQFAASTVETGRVTGTAYRAVKARAARRTQEAEELFARALEYARAARVAQRDLLEAVVLGHKRDYAAAAAAYKRYQSAGGANSGFVGTLVSRLAADSGTGDQEREAQAQRGHELAATFMLRCHDYAETKRQFEILEGLAGPDWWTKTEAVWETASDYGETSEGLGRFDEALDWYDRGIDRLERNRALLTVDELRIALANQRGSRNLYFNAARAALRSRQNAEAAGDLAGSQHYAACAFRYAESGRARALLDLLASEQQDSEAASSARRLHARVATWKGLLAQSIESGTADPRRVAELRQQIAADEEALQAAERELVKSGEAAASDARGSTMQLKEVAELLPAETCILQYAFMNEDLLIWVIGSEGMMASVIASVSAAELTFAIEKLRDLCEGLLPVRRMTDALSTQLLDPVAPVLGRFRRVMIVPHGSSHYLPFHLLTFDGRMFGESHVISYLPSASILKHISRRWHGLGDSLLAIGNPANMQVRDIDGSVLRTADPLPLAQLEAAAVSSFFSNPLILSGDAATHENVLESLQGRRVLHFATHGILDPEQPLLSRILLANGQSLSVFELSGTRLDADLVVLSACETGRGSTTGGDDVLGLARAFLAAGAQSLVLSLWPVDDAAAMVFMVRFYGLVQQGLHPAPALRAAQAEVRAMPLEQVRSELVRLGVVAGAQYTPPNWGAPFFWAPFIYVGNQA